MPPTNAKSDHFDVLICGSGCAGSLLAWILARHNLRVALIDRGLHPRFAIGESSTPLADFLIELMADEFDVPELKPLARWGSWQRNYPELRVGKKRGFSYYGHSLHQPFNENANHSHSLLVAASTDDEVSDTHWMRADVDEWLFQQAERGGVTVAQETSIESIVASGRTGWRVETRTHDQPRTWSADWIIDATGAGGVVPQALGVPRLDDQLLTRTGSLFGHFQNVGNMTDWLRPMGLLRGDDPFDGDDAAQHHVLDDGWVWMLRFACGITSVGFTRPTQTWLSEGHVPHNLHAAWDDMLDRYPTVNDLLGKAKLVGPTHAGGPAQLGWMPRLSRLWYEAAGPQWLALPSTVGVIDPLHSTGLAHALSGVRRAAQLLLNRDRAHQQRLAEEYRVDVVDEVRWIDRLVSTCYAGLPDFELFTAVCSFYFLATIDCERQLRDTGEWSQGFLSHENIALRQLVESVAIELQSGTPQASVVAKRRFIDALRNGIEPWNNVGLLEPSLHNRLARSATKEKA